MIFYVVESLAATIELMCLMDFVCFWGLCTVGKVYKSNSSKRVI